MDSNKVVLILPDRFRAHSIPMEEGLREEIFRAWSEYGHLTQNEAEKYMDTIEVKFASDVVDDQTRL